MNGSYWLSCRQGTGFVEIENSKIIHTCPLWSGFIGQHWKNLINWLEQKWGYVQMEELNG